MNETRFTPGPWVVERGDVLTPDGNLIATAYAGGYTRNGDADRRRKNANARLIAAAPSLYEALAAVADAMLNGGDGGEGDYGWNVTKLTAARPAIRAALALARGEQTEQSR